MKSWFLAGVVAAAQTVTVPFVGCEIDGQAGRSATPEGRPVTIAASREIGEKLAYYAGADSLRVLGPRGWHCFSTYGSGGAALYLTPGAISKTEFFSSRREFKAQVIEAFLSYGDSSGRAQVARMIARFFPSRMDFATGVARDYNQIFLVGPFADDVVSPRSPTEIEFMTPGGKEGAGTSNWVKANGDPIHGLVMLLGDSPNLLTLSMRIPGVSAELRSAIIERVRADWNRR